MHLTEGPPSLKIHRFALEQQKGTLQGSILLLQGPSQVFSGPWWSCTSPSRHGSSCGSSCTAPQWRFDVVASSHERSLSIWSFGHVWSQHREAPRASSVRITFASANLGFFDAQSTPSKHNKPVKPLSSWIFCGVIGKFAGVEGSVFSDLKGWKSIGVNSPCHAQD